MGAMVHEESLGEERQLQRGEHGGRGARQEEMKRASSHLAGETSAVHPKWVSSPRSPRPPRPPRPPRLNSFFWAHTFRLKEGLRTRSGRAGRAGVHLRTSTCLRSRLRGRAGGADCGRRVASQRVEGALADGEGGFFDGFTHRRVRVDLAREVFGAATVFHVRDNY